MNLSQTYSFPNITVNKPGACDQYLRQNLSSTCVNDYQGLSTYPTIIEFDRGLTTSEQSSLNTLMINYVDPAVFLVLDHTETKTLHSDFIIDPYNTTINNTCVLQTLIFSNQNNNSLVLDSLKTVVEYNCPNVQNYLNTTSGNLSIEIYDITRNYSIGSITTPLNEVATQWNIMANQGITHGNVIYRTLQFTNLRNACPNYDIILQLRGMQSDTNYNARLHSLQYLFYTEQ